ncbi:hypothetical protein D3C74_161230 [compost metagenome]
MHLATVIELYSRSIVGWCLDGNMQTGLMVAAMEMSNSRGFIGQGTVLHSDRGAAQCTSDVFQG